MEDDPDLDLVLALQRGEDLALNELMVRHREPLFRFLYRYTRNEAIARDLAQEAFVRAYFGIGSFRPKARFGTWLFQIGLNLCRDYARSKHAKRAFIHEPFPEPGSPGQEPEDCSRNPVTEAVRVEQWSAIHAAIDALPHDLKTALILTAIEERSHKDVAEMLGITPKSVETRVYRARKALSKALVSVTAPSTPERDTSV